jgi:two-component system phosphate regulon sensor histidine kinase PhoR
MARRRLIWKVMPGYVAAIVVCTVALAWYAAGSVSRMLSQQALESIDHLALVLADDAAASIITGDTAGLQRLSREVATEFGYRVTVVNSEGRVLSQSPSDRRMLKNETHRPEFAAALAGERGQAVRRAPDTGRTLTLIARPVRHNGQVIGAVRLSSDRPLVPGLRWSIALHIGVGMLLVALLSAGIFAWLYHIHIARPLRDLHIGARRFAHGRLEQTLRVADTEEIGSLAEALNQMGRQLSEQMQTVREQGSEREAILSSMTEGVLAVDPQQVIISLNRTAALQLGVEAATAPGRGIAEVVRNAPLLRFVARVMKSSEPIEGEIHLSRPGATRTLAASGTALRNLDGTRIGAVVVLNDITRLRELEGLRQQFVANVSHELKTPISAIKAGVETLLDSDEDGPSDPAATAAAAKRFLPMIARQAERLNAIVEDLLTLARLEQETAETPVPLEPMRLLPVLRGAAETVGAKAEARQQTLSMEVEPDLAAIGNDTLLGQAVVNLLDNAIKYSPPGEPIILAARRMGPEVVVEVTDRGPGIEPQHIPRLFERFYRTDKARSRDQGGTGLGLSIVKHVAQTLGGQVTVESEVGRGSTFRIHLVAAGTLNTVPAN